MYKDSGGNDTFVGTSGPDTFTVYAGFDKVTGGGGDDTLIVGYSQTVSLTAGANGLSGYLSQLYEPNASVTFTGIDHLDFPSSYNGDGDTSITLGGTLAPGTMLDFDAGTKNPGNLSMDLRQLTNDVTFKLNADGSMSSSIGYFAHYGTFELQLGDGTNSVITGNGDDRISGGSGNDYIAGGGGNDTLYGEGGTNTLIGGTGDDSFYSEGGRDTISGGSGTDSWTGNYLGSTAGQTLYYDSITGDGSLTPGTILSSIESITFLGGSGDDVVHLTGIADGAIYGGGGVNILSIDESGLTGLTNDSVILYTADGFYAYSLGNLDENTTFDNIQQLDIKFSDDDNNVTAGFSGGSQVLELDGGKGNDTLHLAINEAGNFSFTANADGTVDTNIPNLTLKNFENYAIAFLDGNHTVTTGAGDDKLIGGVGADYFNGGAGDDSLYGNGNDTLIGGDGNDQFYSTGADTMIGGNGNDVYVVNNADDKVIEGPNGGNDEVLSSVSFSLAGQFIESLFLLGSANINATGNNQANLLGGNNGNNIFTTGLGPDVVQEEGKFGKDIITDFTAGSSGVHDTVQFFGSFTNLSAMLAHTQQVGDNVVITEDAGDTLTLQHVTLASLTGSDFIFS